MKKMLALMLAGAIIITTPSLANAANTENKKVLSPYAQGYLDGYDKGNEQGKIDGKKEGEATGYNKGKTDGMTEGYSKGETAGEATGYNKGKTDGYNDGYQKGETAGTATGYNEGREAGYADGYQNGNAAGTSTGYNQGREAGYNAGYQQGKDYGEVKGKVDVYENTVIPMMDQRISDLQSQVNKLYDKVIEMAQKETNVTVTVKTSKNGKKPKVTVKKVSSSSNNNNSVSEPPFVHTVLNAPGLGCTTPVGQGGRLIICGKPTRATFTMRETTSGKVASAQVLAAGIGGKVKNVVETYAPGVRFNMCQVDFKVYGAQNGDIYRVYQIGPNGTWQEIQVDQVREGHVICTVFKTGTFAFIKMN